MYSVCVYPHVDYMTDSNDLRCQDLSDRELLPYGDYGPRECVVCRDLWRRA